MAKIMEVIGQGTVKINPHYCRHIKKHFFGIYEYCPICGEKQYYEQREVHRVCGQCSKNVVEIKGKAFYCAFCGEKFEDESGSLAFLSPVNPDGSVVT